MVKQAREFVRDGAVGTIRKVVVEYPQGWLADAVEKTGQKQAAWRTDPKKSGAAGCMGDIGTHAENLARYITGLEIEELCADLTTFVKGRKLDDDGNVLLSFKGGAKGILNASQICVGDENALNIRVYGTKAALEWHQEHPNELVVKYPDQPSQVWRRGNGYDGDEAKRFTRIPAGHPEGYLEAFGNIYPRRSAASPPRSPAKVPKDLDVPTIDDGVEGMAFIEAVVKSSRRRRWVRLCGRSRGRDGPLRP
jgi:predicted dehydrogenase